MPDFDRKNRLLDLLERWKDLQRGRPAAGPAEVCGDCPELAADLERLAGAVGDMERLAEATTSRADLGETRAAPSGPGDPDPDPVPPVLPRYEVVGKLGEGGMGAVYRARDRLLGRDVALKVVRPAALTADARRRFAAEARAVARLDHPHIITVFDVGEWAADGGPAPYLALEFVPGGSLARRLTADPVAPADAARLARLLAKAVAHAHERGVTHRDLKPDNVLLAAPADEPTLNSAWGVPKIADFGLARATDGGGLTRPGVVMGTPLFMAPEQAEGLPDVGPAADVYSLGAVLYRLLTGRPPFESASLTELLYKVVHEAPPPPDAVAPGVPAGLAGVCLACLAKAPADRPTAAALVVRLEAWAAPSAAPAAVPPPPRRPARRARGPAYAAAGVALVAAGLVATFWPRRAAPAPPAGPPAGARPTAPAADPLRVVALDVEHFAARPGGAVERLGVLGRDSFAATLGDRVRVRARLSRPGYAFVVACQADGGVELCFPETETEAPPLTDEPRYPWKNRAEYYGLREGAGLWAFAVLASADPLPPYRDWLAGRGVPWTPAAVRPGTVWHDDGQWVEALGPGGVVRGDRGKGETVPGQGDVVRVTDWLRRDGGAAAGVGFGVGRP